MSRGYVGRPSKLLALGCVTIPAIHVFVRLLGLYSPGPCQGTRIPVRIESAFSQSDRRL
jgi:hypothetical protein